MFFKRSRVILFKVESGSPTWRVEFAAFHLKCPLVLSQLLFCVVLWIPLMKIFFFYVFSHRQLLPISYVTAELAFVSEEKCLEFLTPFGFTYDIERTKIDCKASAAVLSNFWVTAVEMILHGWWYTLLNSLTIQSSWSSVQPHLSWNSSSSCMYLRKST